MDNIPNGVVIDPRSLEAKGLDHTHEALYGGLPVTWVEKPQSTWALTSQRNQDGSFSCVKQSSATAMEKFLKVPISACGYKLRAGGIGSEGMYLQNCGDIDYNTGTVLESVTPSQNMSDPQLDTITLPTMTIKSTGYRTIATIDIESIAQAIQAYGNCFLIFSSNTDEWQVTPVYLGTPTTFGHCICAVDFALIQGVKTLVCMDSAGQFSSPTGIRLITESFLNARCRGAMYYLGATIVPSTPLTSPVEPPFLTNLRFGQTSPEVARLQHVLNKLGYFAPNPTGYYGSITSAAVLQFQFHTNVVQFGVESVYGAVFGPKSRAALNLLLGS